MVKKLKAKRKCTYQYSRNRKRMNKKNPPSVQCPLLKGWDKSKSNKTNFRNLGLVRNVDTAISADGTIREPQEATPEVKELEAILSEPRKSGFRIPKNQVEFLSYMLDKYGEDYKAMTRDKRNVAQLTWKQFRAKINVFKGIPEQFNPYLESKNKTLEGNAIEKITECENVEEN